MANFFRLIRLLPVFLSLFFSPFATAVIGVVPTCLDVGAPGNTINNGDYIARVTYDRVTSPWRVINNCTSPRPPFDHIGGYFPSLQAQRICPSGYAVQGSDWRDCTPLPACPAGEERIDGVCTPSCTANEERINGVCLEKCGAGLKRYGTLCVPEDCPANTTRINGMCVPEAECPPGFKRVNGVCVPTGCTAGPGTDVSSAPGFKPIAGCDKQGDNYCLVKYTWSLGYPANQYEGGTDERIIWVGTSAFTGASCSPGSGGGTGTTGSGSGTGDGTGNDNGTGTGTGDGTGTGTGDGSGDTGSGQTGGTGNTVPTGGGTTTGAGGTVSNNPVPIGGGVGSTPVGDVTSSATQAGTDGSCPAGTKNVAGQCTKDDTDPDGDGKCPSDALKVEGKCIYPISGGPDGADDGEGDGDGDGFGGSCEGGFICNGDAIQCAIAYEQHRRSCQFYEDYSSTEAQLYESEKGKTGSVTGDLPGNDNVLIGPESFDTSNAFGAGASCIQDLNVTVAGRSVMLPMSRICPYLEILGSILLSISFLLAGRIIMRG